MSGLVWYDENGDGILESGERFQAGVAVELVSDGGATVGTTTTDAAGYYQFDGAQVVNGYYRLHFTPQDGFDLTVQRLDVPVLGSKPDLTGWTNLFQVAPNLVNINQNAGEKEKPVPAATEYKVSNDAKEIISVTKVKEESLTDSKVKIGDKEIRVRVFTGGDLSEALRTSPDKVGDAFAIPAERRLSGIVLAAESSDAPTISTLHWLQFVKIDVVPATGKAIPNTLSVSKVTSGINDVAQAMLVPIHYKPGEWYMDTNQQSASYYDTALLSSAVRGKSGDLSAFAMEDSPGATRLDTAKGDLTKETLTFVTYLVSSDSQKPIYSVTWQVTNTLEGEKVKAGGAVVLKSGMGMAGGQTATDNLLTEKKWAFGYSSDDDGKPTNTLLQVDSKLK